MGVCSAEPWSDWRGREPTDFSKILGLRPGEPRRKFKRRIVKSFKVDSGSLNRRKGGRRLRKGFKLAGLTPNMTRRAQCVNWLLYYREQLMGKTVEELRRERERDVEKENLQLRRAGATTEHGGGGVQSSIEEQD